jgi:hypothetical protein
MENGMPSKVTDPALLAELNGDAQQPITDPALLAELNGEAPKVQRQSDSFMSRVGTGLMDPIVGAGQIADKVIDPIRQRLFPGATSMADVIKQRDAEYQAPEGFDVARLVGNVANPVTWASPMSKLGNATKVASMFPRTTQAAMAGAGQSVLAPVNPDEDFAQEKGVQALGGAAGGAVMSKLLRGFVPTKEAQALMDHGIQPTFGQSWRGIGPRGYGGEMVNKVEQKATSIPFVGDAISHARARPLQEFEQAVISRVAPGAKTVEEANQYAGKLYDEVVPHLQPTVEAFLGIKGAVINAMKNPELTDEGKRVLNGLVEKHTANLSKLGDKGSALKAIDSELGFLARKYQAGDPASKTLADELYNVQTGLRKGLEAGLPPELQGKLAEANRVWKALIPINKAASSNANGAVMPRPLQRAMARHQRTDVTRMKPDDLVDNAVAVLPSSVPDSGTAGRLILGGGSALGANAFGILPELAVAGTVAGAGALRPAQAALMGNIGIQRALRPHEMTLAQAMMAALRARSQADDPKP